MFLCPRVEVTELYPFRHSLQYRDQDLEFHLNVIIWTQISDLCVYMELRWPLLSAELHCHAPEVE